MLRRHPGRSLRSRAALVSRFAVGFAWAVGLVCVAVLALPAAAPAAAPAVPPAPAVPAVAAVPAVPAVPAVSAAAAPWRAPVAGAVARPFDYSRAAAFRAGAHRGVDLAAPPGSVVRAACAGTVVTAGASPGGRVVTLRCGRWRVTHLPLGSVAVRAGAHVRAGDRLGIFTARTAHTAHSAHAGLHVGVRAAGDRFGYVDPAPMFTAPPPSAPPPALVPRARPPAAPVVAPPNGVSAPVRAPRRAAEPQPVAEDRAVAAPQPVATRVTVAAAPGPASALPLVAWLGLALAAAGASGGRAIALRRRASARGAAARATAAAARRGVDAAAEARVR